MSPRGDAAVGGSLVIVTRRCDAGADRPAMDTTHRISNATAARRHRSRAPGRRARPRARSATRREVDHELAELAEELEGIAGRDKVARQPPWHDRGGIRARELPTRRRPPALRLFTDVRPACNRPGVPLRPRADRHPTQRHDVRGRGRAEARPPLGAPRHDRPDPHRRLAERALLRAALVARRAHRASRRSSSRRAGSGRTPWPSCSRRTRGSPTTSATATRDGVGDSWYADPAHLTIETSRPFLSRGVPFRFKAYDLPFLRWLDRTGKRVDVLSDRELDRTTGDELARAYRLIVFPGHHEYVTEAAYDAVERYRDLGGNLAFLSANNFYWKVTRAAGPDDACAQVARAGPAGVVVDRRPVHRQRRGRGTWTMARPADLRTPAGCSPGRALRPGRAALERGDRGRRGHAELTEGHDGDRRDPRSARPRDDGSDDVLRDAGGRAGIRGRSVHARRSRLPARREGS